MKILIAEDDPLSGRLLQRAVEKFGHESCWVRDGREAWNQYSAIDFDVIISDWMMPDLDGAELCRRIRESSRDHYTYFIFMTAMDSKEHFLTGMKAGADDYLMKPVDFTELKVSLFAADRVTTLHRELNHQKAELERLNLELKEQARRDPLTHLHNRLRLREDFEMLNGMMDRYGFHYAVALCDIDGFKLYNDHYGHLAGDEALCAVARIIEAECRSSDQAYRFGGEEFLVVFPEQTLEDAYNAAERLRRAVEDQAIPHAAKTPDGILTISIGLAACCSQRSAAPEKLLKEADLALYRAKTSGRNVVVAHTPLEDLQKSA